MNLNDIMPEGEFPDEETEHLFKEQAHGIGAVADVFFDNLPSYLCERIGDAHFVAGCMAWLTNRRVLGALASVPGGCQVVVQKEDFLRPGAIERNELMSLYRALWCPDRDKLPTRTLKGRCALSYAGDPECAPVRCMGVRHRRGENGPRMHHKFFVFFNADLEPYAVWTGSFNATENGARSRENAVYLRSPQLAKLYAVEWTRTLALSESLDWNSAYVEPDWRFGS